MEFEMLFDKLPREIVFQIFVRLPMTDLVRCAFTCRTLFEYIITNPEFLKARTRKTATLTLYAYQNKDDARQYYSLKPDNVNDGDDDSLAVAVSQQYAPTAKPMPVQGAYHRAVNVVGSVDGVICLSDDLYGTKQIYSIDLWNPCIGKIVRLPQPRLQKYSDMVLGFGHQRLDDEYKVVRFAGYKTMSAEVYSTKTGSWRWVCQPPPSCRIRTTGYGTNSYYSQCYLRGACHWPSWKECETSWSSSWSSIVTFNTKDEVFGEIKLPPKLEGQDADRRVMLAPMGLDHTTSKLALMEASFKESYIWVMNQYGVADSWNPVWGFRREHPELYSMPLSFSFRKDSSWLVLSFPSRLATVLGLVGFDSEDGVVRILEHLGESLALAFLCSYVESFGLLRVKKAAPGGVPDLKRRKLAK